MNWTQVKIYTTTEGIEPVGGILLCLGINGFSIEDAQDFKDFLSDTTIHWDYVEDELMKLSEVETSVTAYLPENAQGRETLSLLKNELKRLKGMDDQTKFGRLEVSLVSVREEDWENNWKQYFKPFLVGDRFVIKPSWEEYQDKTGRHILELDPGSSFGTGQHHTTQLCIEQLERVVKEGDCLLDLGCGSGILSIAALMLGAQQAVAVDIEENAVRIALENAEKNGITPPRLKAFCGDILESRQLQEQIGYGKYDVVVANIVADVLIAMSPLFGLFLKPDGRLICSGVIMMRKQEVIDALEQNGYVIDVVGEKQDWAAISAIRQ